MMDAIDIAVATAFERATKKPAKPVQYRQPAERQSGMTAKQAELYCFLKDWPDQLVPPSYEEMKVALGLASKSGVHRLIVGLEERGFVVRPEGRRARSIRAVNFRPAGNIATPDLIEELRQRGFFVTPRAS